MLLKLIIFHSILTIEFSFGMNNTTEGVVGIPRSQYDRLMILRGNYWKIKNGHVFIKENWKRIYRIEKAINSREVRRCQERLIEERDNFEIELEKLRQQINYLTRFRYLSIVKTHIELYETHTVNFSPNMSLVNEKPNSSAQHEEIRRQRWIFLLENFMHIKQVNDLLVELASHGIPYMDFTSKIARGYELILNQLKLEKLNEESVLETLPNFNTTIFGDEQIDKYLVVLMSIYNKEILLFEQYD